MNKHIKKYLESYLNLDKPEFAVLLTGKWGSGKTYFIDKFIENNTKEEEIKFIKISLFGLKEVDSIDEQIFQNLHPFLGNKYVKLTGSIAKNALKFGINLNDDLKTNIGVSSIDFSDFFSDKKKSKVKIIFVFDDLERTDIDLTEVLGYINYLVEQSDFNVILLANEEKLIEEEVKSESTKYIEFKEKVIGKTFEVQHDFDSILISLISENTDKSKKYLNENKAVIKDIYSKAEHHNLRHIKQILLDFEYFVKEVNEKYLNNKEFISILINNFFALSIELKSGLLEEKELYDKPDYNFNKDKEKSNVTKIYEKYNIDKNLIFSGKGWVMVLLKNSVSKEVINDVFSKLSFFIEEKKSEQASWVKLWYYRELDNNDFEIVLKDVIDKFKNCSYETPVHFLHVIALLIVFSKEKLSPLSLDDIKNQIEKCIEKYKMTSLLKDELFENGIGFNRTGLRFMNEEDKDFRELFEYIREENSRVYNSELQIKEAKNLEVFLLKIIDWDKEFVVDFLLNEYEGKPIFKNLSSQQLIDTLSHTSNKNITELGYILHARYFERYSCNLIDELSFWKALKDDFEYKKEEGLRKHLLKQFKKYRIDEIIEKLEKCNKNA